MSRNLSKVYWTFQYDAGGMRTRRYDSETGTAYTYRYNDGLLRQMIISSDEVSGSFTFRYDNTGKPISFYYNLTDKENAVSYSGEAFYVVNVQGDVIGLISEEMDSIGDYTYDAWGVVRSVEASNSNGYEQLIMNLNPLRYRGYVYDTETGLYYLQSRYYNPEMGRFINADVYVATGQGFVGNNMFAYCLNNPVNMIDASGNLPQWLIDTGEWLIDAGEWLVDKGEAIWEAFSDVDWDKVGNDTMSSAAAGTAEGATGGLLYGTIGAPVTEGASLLVCTVAGGLIGGIAGAVGGFIESLLEELFD